MHYRHVDVGKLAMIVLAAIILAKPSAQESVVPTAQAPPPSSVRRALRMPDYEAWRQISNPQLSPDGRWAAYGLSFANTPPDAAKPQLILVNLEDYGKVEIPKAAAASFSTDSTWFAYLVESVVHEPGRGGPDSSRVRRLELRNLTTGAVDRTFEGIESFSFSPSSTHLMIQRRHARSDIPAPAPVGPGQAEHDITLVDLRTGQERTLTRVSAVSFNRAGNLLAHTTDTATLRDNGLFVLDLDSGRTVTLDRRTKRYDRLTWNEAGTALAVLIGSPVESMRERNNALVVYADVRAIADEPSRESQSVTLDPATDSALPNGWVISNRAALSWSDDSTRVYFGIKEQSPATAASGGSSEDLANVDVWNTIDQRSQSGQVSSAEEDRNFTYRSAFVVREARFVRLTDETLPEIEIALTGIWAVGRSPSRGWHSQRDLYRINSLTGVRTLMLTSHSLRPPGQGISPNGRYFLYWKDEKFYAYDLEAGLSRLLGGRWSSAFADAEFDWLEPRWSYGIAGYQTGGTAVIAYGRNDLWLLPLDGAVATNLTNGEGAGRQIRFRLVRPVPLDPLSDYGPGGIAAARRLVNTSEPLMLSAFGERSKKSGFFLLLGHRLRELVYEDASYRRLVRAAAAETYLFTRATFAEFPDLRVSGPSLVDWTKISDANPQQAEFIWGRRILFDYAIRGGIRLQGILAIPDDHRLGQRRPMLVNFYGKRSGELHDYEAPWYLSDMGRLPMQAVSEGYLVMEPDIHFRGGSTHTDMLECVEAATRKVIEMGYADPKRIGVMGQSFGGEGAAYIGVRSKLFAAVGVSAGVTDLSSDFNNGAWYYLYGQGRWGFSPWERPDVYRNESAITHVKNASSPILIMHGTADPNVSFSEGLKFFNALKFHKKTAVLLAYPGEGHGLSNLANRKDFTTRFFEFFNHYLKGEPAPKWLTEGVPFLQKNR